VTALARRVEAAEPAGEPVVVLAPLSLEARAIRAGAPGAQVQRVGMGPRRAARSGAAAGDAPVPARAVLVAGFCGALDPTLAPGDVVLASELRDPRDATVATADPTILAGVLRRAGMRVHVGPIASSEKVVRGGRRRDLAATGALAVDMESAWLAGGWAAAGERPFLILRVVVDTGARELHRPLRTLAGAATAYRALRRASALIDEWSRALDAREVVLASPRASCAGVDRAVAIVDAALADRGRPVYVRKQIVHNAHVVGELERRGAVFVEELDEVPRGATVVFSAHGVSPEVRRAAAERELDVIDATCPLVAKVHAEARRFAQASFDIVLVGHEGHEEIDGTRGEAPERTRVIGSVEEVAALEVDDPERVAYLTQTTLAVDETAAVVAALRERFPAAVGPPSADICYATQNRQDAVRGLAAACDLILVVGSANSSNSRRLVEVAERAGCRARLIEDAAAIAPAELVGARRIGLTAGASAPEALVQEVVRALAGLGAVNVSEHRVATENLRFKLPPEARQRSQ
jgi:4-hydroxy-3-methylbut-2-en-1-yl diphosphate reductase